MKNKKTIYAILAVLLALFLILEAIIFYSQTRELKISFLDVGQGDAILLSRGNNQVLIDGGPSGQRIMEKLGRHIPFWDRKIETLLITHPDADHIEGLVDVLKNYQIGLVIETEATSDSAVYAKLEETIKDKNIQKLKGQAGVKIKLDEKNVLEILNSQDKNFATAKDTNASSLVVKLNWNKDTFLFTGDLPSEKEQELMDKNTNLSARVLKIAHHGSKYSTSPDFLDKVSPQEAIISSGKSNRYGHPAPEVLERLKAKKINILRTDELGDIIYQCFEFKEFCQRIAN